MQKRQKKHRNRMLSFSMITVAGLLLVSSVPTKADNHTKVYMERRNMGTKLWEEFDLSELELERKQENLEKEEEEESPSNEYLKTAQQQVEDIETQLDLYKEAMEQLKNLLDITHGGSLESQLESIVTKVQQKLIYLEDLKNEIERQVGNYGNLDTEGMTQVEAIFAKIYALRKYADNLKVFHDVIEGIVTVESNPLSNEKIYEILCNQKDQLMEYHKFLDQAETLLDLEGGNGSDTLHTGEQTRKELEQIVAKLTDWEKQLKLVEQTLQILLENESISVENAEELNGLFTQVVQQKERSDQFLERLKTLLELHSDVEDQEVYQTIFTMKERLKTYWAYLGEVEELLQIPEGSESDSFSNLISPAMIERLRTIYEKLTNLIKEQDQMAIQIEQFQQKEEKNEVVLEEWKQLTEELFQQKEQTKQFLASLKELLGLEDSAKEEEIFSAIVQIKETLTKYWLFLGEVEELLQLPDGSGGEQQIIVTGPAVTVRVTNFYEKLTEMVKEQTQMEKTIQTLLEQEKTTAETIKEWEGLLAEVTKQKQQTDHFLKELKEILELEEDATDQEVLDYVTGMKEKLRDSLQWIRDLMEQLDLSASEEDQEALFLRLKEVFHQTEILFQQLTEEIQKTEEAQEYSSFLEEENQSLKVENESLKVENQSLKAEHQEWLLQMEQLKEKQKELERKLSFLASNSSSNQEASERENQLLKEKEECKKNIVLLQERIAELEKQLLIQTEEMTVLTSEKKQGLEILVEKEQQIEEGLQQIEQWKVQLMEKDQQILELQNQLEQQKSIKELLEQKQINYQQLYLILNEREHQQKISLIEKETIQIPNLFEKSEYPLQDSSNSDLSSQEFSKEDLSNQETSNFESSNQETETLEEVSLKTEESSSELEEGTEVEKEEETEEAETKQEEEKKTSFSFWGFLRVCLLIFLLLLLFSGILLFFSWKKKGKN